MNSLIPWGEYGIDIWSGKRPGKCQEGGLRAPCEFNTARQKNKEGYFKRLTMGKHNPKDFLQGD